MKLNKLQRFIGKLGMMFLVFAVMIRIQPSNAGFVDVEESVDNRMGSTALDMEIQIDEEESLLSPDDPWTKTIKVINSGKLDFEYDKAFLVPDEENSPLCSDLGVLVEYGEDEVYSGDFDGLFDHEYIHPDILGSLEEHEFTYEIGLPEGADYDYSGLNCKFHLKSYAWQEEIGEPEVGFWDVEELEIEIQAASWGACVEMSGTKKDSSGNGLGGFEIVIHPTHLEPVQTLSVDSTNPDGVDTLSLADGRKYLVEVSGTWTNQGGSQSVDANYVSGDNWSTHFDYDDEDAWDTRIIDLVIDDEDINWGSYNESHLYKYVLSGEGESINLKISEAGDPNPPSWYGDNNGSLSVRIYDVTDEIVVTNENGEWAREVCGLEVQVVEVAKVGWEQVSPTEPSYYHVDLEVYEEEPFSLDFVNQPISVKINEVYYQQGNPEEFVELYNPTSYAVELKGWKISDNNTTDTIPDITIKPRGFALLVTDSSTVSLHAAADPETPIVSVGTTIGNGLANEGDHLVLLNEIDIEVDKMGYSDDVSIWNPTGLSAPSGSSLNRIPKGHDTDSPSDWQTNPSPNPGTNPHSQSDDLLEILIPDSTLEIALPEESTEEAKLEEQLIVESIEASGSAEIE